MRAAWVVSVVVLGTGCKPANPAIAESRLASGSTIADLTRGRDSAYLLVLDPMDCLTCWSTVAAWQEVRRTRGSVFFVLTRRPTPDEEVLLRLYRVRADGILATRAGAMRPAEHLLIRGEVTQSSLMLSGGGRSYLLGLAAGDRAPRR